MTILPLSGPIPVCPLSFVMRNALILRNIVDITLRVMKGLLATLKQTKPTGDRTRRGGIRSLELKTKSLRAMSPFAERDEKNVGRAS